MAVLDLDWRKWMRWFILATIVMVLWSLVPTARCAWTSFRAEPLNEATPISATEGSHSDSVPISERGFFERWGSAIKQCYARTPLLGQEKWKRNLLLGFAAAALLMYALSEIERRNKKTYS